MLKINLHIYPSPYKFETRINKEVTSIEQLNKFDSIIIAGTWAEGLSINENQSDKISIVRIKTGFETKHGFLFKILNTLLFNIKLYQHFRKMTIEYINCHSLWALPLSVFLKRKHDAKLIYDAHELETERAGLKGFKQKIAKVLERRLIKYCDKIIVVGDFIAEWYKKEYKRDDVYSIRNVPNKNSAVKVKSNILRELFGLSSEDVIFIYQGIINKGRGVDILIDAFKDNKDNKHLVIMGYGNQEYLAKEASKRHQNIHFIPAVLPKEIPLYTSGADVGVFMVENIGLSYYLCLPNKFFEYLYCGLPVIVSDFPEMKSIVDKYNCGWTIPPRLEEIKDKVRTITNQEIYQKKGDLDRFHEEVNWETDSAHLKNVFNV